MSLKTQPVLRFDDCVLDPARRSFACADCSVSLSPKTFDLLAYLAANSGRLVTKEELLTALWPDSFVEERNLSQHVFLLRKALASHRLGERIIVTVPGRGYQFAAQVEEVSPSPAHQEVAVLRATESITHLVIEEGEEDGIEVAAVALPAPPEPSGRMVVAGVLLGLLVAAGAGWLFFSKHKPPLDHIEVVVADIENATGDPAFGRPLNEALRVDLVQSPFLAVVSRAKVQSTLSDMQRKDGEALTPAVAREICQRNNAQAVLGGTVARFGQKYLLTLDATDCASGDVVAESKRQADTVDRIPGAIDELAGEVRKRLGESRASLKKYDHPLFDEVTGSFEALQAFSEASRLGLQGKYMESVPFFERAIELDPGFAVAYLDLGAVQANLGEAEAANTSVKKAYELREHTDEQTRLFIIARYHERITGDVWETIRNYQTWANIYPRNPLPWASLANMYTQIGQPEQAIPYAQRDIQLNDKGAESYVILARAQLHAGQLDQAKATTTRSLASGKESPQLHTLMMEIAYAQHDKPTVDAEMAWAEKNVGAARVMVNASRIAFAEGRAQAAEELMEKAAVSYKQQGMAQMAPFFLIASARNLAEEGLTDQARRLLDTIPLPPNMTDPLVAMAETGESGRAASLLKQELQEHPVDTLWQNSRGPQIRAAILLAQNKPREAIAALKPGAPYDLRDYDLPTLRGRAYLALSDGAAAEKQFRNVLDHPGVDSLADEYPMAHLGLARAYVLEKNSAAARSEYRTFLDLWKNADADLPLLVQARTEFGKLEPSRTN